LRVFIDGVPPAKGNIPAGAKDGSKVIVTPGIEITAQAQQVPATFYHAPFLEKQCDSCHDTKSSQKLISRTSELCFTCHDDFSKNKKTVHYPVSEGSCLECHDPHQSPNKFILKKPSPQICFNCHEEKDIKANPAHEGQSNCLECHNPHSSNDEKLLK